MKVISKQRNSKDCIICGFDNPFGVRAQFYELENKTVVSLFKYHYNHQSYPERVHGGMITAMLDELGCRAYWAYSGIMISAVTMSLETKYRKPVSYNHELKAIGKIVKDNPRYFDAECAIFDYEKNILATATMRYLKLNIEKVCKDATFESDMPYLTEDNINEIDIINF